MTIKLDLKDKKILFELDKNSRQALSELGKNVGLSKESVYHRVKNLEKNSIITGYTIVTSLAKLNFMQIKLLIKFQNINRKKKQEIINFFVNYRNTNWVGSCKGAYDFMIGFVVKDLTEFKEIKDEIFSKYSDFIFKEKISIMLETNFYGRKHFINKLQDIKHYIGFPEKIKLDNLDLKILKMLSANTRIRVIDIASRLNTTARKIAYKIRNLEKTRIIEKYTVSINHEKLGISFFKLFIYLKNVKNKAQILDFLKNQTNCLLCVEALAEWDLEPEFEVYSPEQFYNIMDEIEEKFGDQINRMDVILIDKEYKFNLLPKLANYYC